MRYTLTTMPDSLVRFSTPYGELACREAFDGKAIAHLRTHSTYMESDLMLMRAFIRPEDEIADVGANIGAFVLPFSQFAKRVHAFEPIPETADHLASNLAANAIKNVTVHRVGLSNKEGKLYPHRAADAGSTSLTSNQEGEAVPVTTLDTLFHEGGLSFIKIDVEGMEAPVLEGAQKLIAASRPVIFFEIQKDNMNAFGASFFRFTKLLPDYAFFFNLHVPQDGTYKLGRLPWLGFLRFSSGTQNVLAVPKEKMKGFTYVSPLETSLTLVIRKIRNRLMPKHR